MAAYAFIHKHKEGVFAFPSLVADAFGLVLSDEYFVSTVPPFPSGMTLAEFEGNSLIGFMSEAMCSFLGATVEDYPNQGAIHWLNSVCDPECVREAALTPMADHSIRK